MCDGFRVFVAAKGGQYKVNSAAVHRNGEIKKDLIRFAMYAL